MIAFLLQSLHAEESKKGRALLAPVAMYVGDFLFFDFDFASLPLLPTLTYYEIQILLQIALSLASGYVIYLQRQRKQAHMKKIEQLDPETLDQLR